MASVFKPLECVKNMLGESASICQIQKCLLASYKTSCGLLLICLFASQLSVNSEIWSDADSRFGGELLLPNRLLRDL